MQVAAALPPSMTRKNEWMDDMKLKDEGWLCVCVCLAAAELLLAPQARLSRSASFALIELM